MPKSWGIDVDSNLPTDFEINNDKGNVYSGDETVTPAGIFKLVLVA